MTVKIYVPRDSAALAVGAERVVKTLQAEIAARRARYSGSDTPG